MSENETLADIRKESEARFRELLEKHVDGLGHIQAMQQFNQVFDRIEAATQREREATGNSAALRKALITLRENLHVEKIDGCACGPTYIGPTVCAFTLIDAALAAPARNCDVYDNPYDAADAWPDQEMCAGRRHHEGTCDGCKYSPARCVAKWLYDGAKKERGDESPRTEQESEVQG